MVASILLVLLLIKSKLYLKKLTIVLKVILQIVAPSCTCCTI